MYSNDSKIANKYEFAYNKLNDIFTNINKELSLKEEVNPIEYFSGRIKSHDSIEKKLLRKGFAFTEENIDNVLYDVVGFRIVCSFLSDVESIIDVIRIYDANGVFKIIPSRTKNYIETPKKNGYSSYHMGIKVPIFYNGEEIFVNAEIQIRTVAMDMANSLEHKIFYKKENFSKNLLQMIREASCFCSVLDEELDSVVKSREVLKNDNVSLMYPFMNSVEYDLFKSRYDWAVKKVLDKFSFLKESYDSAKLMNPIEHTKGRIKNNASVVRKLNLKKEKVNIENIKNYVNDFAGVRVVCSFLSDIEVLKEFVKNDKELIFIDEKDYVKYPKFSGYRGYHIIVGVPVYTMDGEVYVKVEIQIRTVAMEMWASLEEKIGYHKEISSTFAYELRRNSSIISVFDSRIDDLYNKFNEQKLNSDVKVLKRVKN